VRFLTMAVSVLARCAHLILLIGDFVVSCFYYAD